MNMHSKSNIILSFLIWLVFGLLALGQLQRIQLGADFSFYAHDVVIVILVFWMGWRYIQQVPIEFGLRFWQKWWLELLLLSWIIGGWLLGLLQGENLVNSVLYASRLIIYTAAVILITKDQPWKELLPEYASSKVLRGLVVFCGLLVLGLGYLQYLLLPDTRFLHILGWDDHYYRLIGTQLDPGFTGILLILTIFNVERFGYFPVWLKKILQLLLVFAVALTFSRASYLALLISLIYVMIKTYFKSGVKATLWWITLGCWLGLSIPFLPKPAGEGVQLLRTSTAVARTSRTKVILASMTPQDWVVGKGLFTTIVGSNPHVEDEVLPDHARFPDSLPAALLMWLGGVGAVLLTVVMLKWLWPWRFNMLIIASLLAVVSHSLFNNTLLQPFVWLLLWFGVGSEVLKKQESRSVGNGQ